MATSFNYSVSGDFSNGIYQILLDQEIRASAIVPNLIGVNTEGTDQVIITFDTDLSGGEVIILDGLVAAHNGISQEVQDEPTPEEEPPIGAGPHAFDGSQHTPGTLSGINALISGSTLIDTTDFRLSDAREPLSHTHSTFEIVSGTFADARIAASNITQHEASINHDNLLNFVLNEHIDWTQDQGATDVHADNVPDGADATAIHDNTANEISAIAEKTAPVDADLVIIEDSEAGFVKKKAQITNVVGLFGTNFVYAQNTTVQTTTSTDFQQVLRLAANSIPAGTYRLAWSYSWNHDATTHNFEARIEQDDTTELWLHDEEPKDSSGAFGVTGTDQKQTAAAIRYLVLGAGSYTFDLDYRTEDANDESSIWNATIEFWRVE